MLGSPLATWVGAGADDTQDGHRLWPCFPGKANSPAGSTGPSSSRNCCATTSSATRTSAPSGSTRRPATTMTSRYGSRPSTSFRGTPATWRCGPTGSPYRQPFIETADAVFAEGTGARLHPGLRRRMDRVRRLAVRRLARHRALPLVPVRRGCAVGRRAVPDDPGTRRVEGDLRQVVRRLRRDDHADAAARTCSAHSPPMPATRSTSCATSRSSARPPGHCAGTTTTSSAGGTTSAPAPRSPRTPTRCCWACSAAPRASPPVRTARPSFPFDPRTGAVRPEVWQRWLDWDPVRMVDRYADALRSLDAIWIDAGTKDEYFLDLGAEAFRAGLAPDRRRRREGPL